MTIRDSLFDSPDASTSARWTEDESIGFGKSLMSGCSALEPAARPEPEERPRSSLKTILVFSAVLRPSRSSPGQKAPPAERLTRRRSKKNSSDASDVADPISAQPQQRFSGMTLPVAEFLANNVFCLLDDHKDNSKRISARAFGNWIKDLPNLLDQAMALARARGESGSAQRSSASAPATSRGSAAPTSATKSAARWRPCWQVWRRGKKKPVDAPLDPEGWHQCDLVCGKPLSCGNHCCAERGHNGACPPCLHSLFDKRNALLAEALGIHPDGDRCTNQVMYPDKLASFARANAKSCMVVKLNFADFLAMDKKSQVLPHMPEQKRKSLHDRAAVYCMDTQMVDQKPHQSVQLIRRVDSCVPAPLLSASVSGASAGLSGLVNLTDLRPAGSDL
ncbi:hypothetical protein BD311DRAFT_741812 [Dichomitus squalens]|uniref:R3H domain-containing protein n=1 Tax=Dichomitus squalens TaxID=114155 RepID=A0A4Q9MAX0_9APHY|nr:hypothetical protein BD311DRAFT_741812 [Dichomitus squalens]